MEAVTLTPGLHFSSDWMSCPFSSCRSLNLMQSAVRSLDRRGKVSGLSPSQTSATPTTLHWTAWGETSNLCLEVLIFVFSPRTQNSQLLFSTVEAQSDKPLRVYEKRCKFVGCTGNRILVHWCAPSKFKQRTQVSRRICILQQNRA